MFFSVITKNLNWEISTKNLVTFKRWDGVKDEKIQYGNSLKNPILREGIKNQYIGSELPEKGGYLPEKERIMYLSGVEELF